MQIRQVHADTKQLFLTEQRQSTQRPDRQSKKNEHPELNSSRAHDETHHTRHRRNSDPDCGPVDPQPDDGSRISSIGIR